MPEIKKIGILFFLLFFFLIDIRLSHSQEEREEKEVIQRIKIEGNRKISDTFILSHINSKAGGEFSLPLLNKDIKQLYKTGYFEDVRIKSFVKEKGVEIVIEVKEKPVLTQILIEGNRVFSKRYLDSLLRKEDLINKPIDKAKLKKVVKEIEEVYKQRGYYLCTIKQKVEVEKERNEAIVHLLIDEGRRMYVRDICIEGNKEFSDRRILKLLRTRKKWLFNSGILKEDVLRKDIQRLEELYREAGYADVQITPIVSYNRKGEVFVTLKIKEGNRYKVGRVLLEGNKALSKEEIGKELKLLPGDIFTEKKLERDVWRVGKLYFDKGYLSSSISPQTLLNRETSKIDILYQIKEGEPFYVNRIDIKGNVISKDVVIRREINLFPGERFDGKKLEESLRNLKNLGYFEEVDYEIKDSELPNRKDLVIKVKEAKTGEFSFGGGYSSVDKGIGFIEIAQSNFDINNFPTFSGGGQDLRVKAEFGRTRSDYLLSFTEPWFGGKPLSVGFDLYNRAWEREDYDEGRKGGDIRISKAFNKIWRWSFLYCLEEVEISSISGDSLKIEDITREEGRNILSSLTFQVIRDTRDSKIDPHKGNVLNNSLEFAGLGGDKKFNKYVAEMSQFFSPPRESKFSDLVLEVRMMTGLASDREDAGVPIYERFYAGGGGTIRGYKYRKVGPRLYGKQIGGEAILLASVELRFPLVKDVIKAAIFYDMGNVWEKTRDIDLCDLKKGAGVGVRISTPIGPIKLDYGYGFDPEPGEKREGHFYFSMSRDF